VSGSDANADAPSLFCLLPQHHLERTFFPYALCFEADTIANTWAKSTTIQRGRGIWSVSHDDALQRTTTVVTKRSSMNV
jgi:hypothetical protein